MTYSSRIRFISIGFLTVSLKELLPVESSRIISSCWMISCACSTQFSQICPSWPAMSIFTSSRLRPQKEQCNVFFAIIAYYQNDWTTKLPNLLDSHSRVEKTVPPAEGQGTVQCGVFNLH